MIKKRIAIFATGWSSKIIEQFVNGMNRAFGKNGGDAFLFLAYPDPTCKDSEFNIFNLPDLSFFDGAIVLSQSIDDKKVLNALLKHCKESGIPTISCGHEYRGIYNAKVGNADGMYELCMHLINVHNVKHPVFIAGDKENGDSNERLAVLKKCFAKKGISISDKDIVYTSWDIFVAMDFIEKIQFNQDDAPDAIVCANDGLAMAVSIKLEELGLSAPEDVILTGYDFLPESQYFYPGISSVDQQFEEYGYSCTMKLLDIAAGHKSDEICIVPTKFVPGESCGCNQARDNARIRAIAGREAYKKRIDINGFDRELVSYELCFSGSDSLTTLNKKLSDIVLNGKTYVGDTLHIMLQPAAFSPSRNAVIKDYEYCDTMETLVSIEEGVPSQATICSKTLLFPGYSKKGPNHAYAILPLYDKKIMLGYLVVRDRLDFLSNNFLQRFQNRIGMSLLKFRKSHNLNVINNKLNKLVNKDSLTNVKNRTAYEDDVKIYNRELKQNHNLSAIMFDINNLKTINDELGHNFGDSYIINSCQLICSVFSHSTIYRIGGDEFVCIPNNIDYIKRYELIKEMRSIMDSLSKDESIPREKRISIAIGIADFDPRIDKTFSDVFKRSDTEMYRNKAEMKKKMKK